MDPLHLVAPRAVWERYLRGQRPDDAHLVEAWDRARTVGASPEGLAPEDHLLGATALAPHRDSLAPMLAEGSAVLDQAARAFADRDHVLLLADAAGVVTFAAGGGGFADEARRLRLIAGATWSEDVRGTNAIGTALASGRGTVVEGAGHFGQRYHGLVCYAAPIRGPDGQIVAVLDATSFQTRADGALAAMVSAAALALEALGRSRAWAEAGRSARALIERTLDRVDGVGLLVEPPGRIVRSNATGRVWLGATPLPRDVRALGLGWEQLVTEAFAPTPGGLRVRGARLRVEPIVGGSALLGLAVFGDAVPVRLPTPSTAPDPFRRVFAEDPATATAVAFARKVAGSDLPVVLLSETGSGKELFAEAMHAASARASGPFVPVNCGSLSPHLLESELFGYAPGAFTGAEKRGREGLLHAAHGGTLFLDEVAEMPPPMQTALLRVLETGQYLRVGDSAPRKVDVRVICATCRDLVGMVDSGAFRRDLYFRLKSVTVTLPPLRARTDRLALARHLLGADAPPFSTALARWLETYPWPGNVRELKAVLGVVELFGGDAAELDVAHLPPDLVAPVSVPVDPATPAPGGLGSLAEVELATVQRVLAELGGNVSAAARRLGVARSTIYRMLRRH